ncbi:Enoyl-CoA hydratase/carnithine racemase [Thermosyntropha lipolytica DSM 11003]|uniref:Enoyl-CoA hydratase/carnithine racemase n=1 Tax=Thermosyntropha lipolytica DSM 11003 TaxID=1123382 RepID=A0A1M5PRX0_9FIRM|nr:enoyl-CoA hydratase/isomerase family protein [Thermosyntropha lipolytica]SHH04043.1 Enoyl-CoA hydratase/carnithine racemase [Thermosyntropha lipolytica DSM 11003]
MSKYEYRIEDNIIIFNFCYGRVKAIHQDTLKGLEEAIDRVNQEEELKGIIITGQDRYFSGGFDLETFTTFESPEAIVDWFKYEEEVLYKLFTCSKPVVAAINGHATAAGMIVAMACDYKIAKNHPKIKIGMTEIKIGLSLTPAEGEIMRFGLGTEKNFRDIIFKGELVSPAYCFERGIFDELVEDDETLIKRAKEVITSYIDTPGRPFILLKYLERKPYAEYMRKFIDSYDFNLLIKVFTDESIINTLKAVKAAIS